MENEDAYIPTLKKYWGYRHFRPLQREVIESIMEGRDTLALMPTGGGKSLCFQLPSMLKEGICLVVSPLIALMKDQVAHLEAKGIAALTIHSGMTFKEVNKTLKNAAYGPFKFLYVSPERLKTELFRDYISVLKIHTIVVDEAHCISQWGYDFRPAYLKIAELRELGVQAPVLALTASATPDVQQDICTQLQFREGYCILKQSFERPNLSYSAFAPSSRVNKLLEILSKVKGSSIVYCKTRKRTKEVAALLKMHGEKAAYYHAGLHAEDRSNIQEAWVGNRVRVICCTNAFGMGIDKPDVRTVIHYDMPESLENYYQEAGRAGRDGRKAYAVLLYHKSDTALADGLAATRYPPLESIRKVFASLCNYFQLGAGRGEGRSFDFDIIQFVKHFRHDLMLVHHVLKILEQEEILMYSEQFFAPSTVGFTTDKRSLEDFENDFPKYEPLVKGLLRSYDHIFDNETVVRETQLAKFIRREKSEVIRQLKELSALKIIRYTPQKEVPQVYFLEDRSIVEELQLDMINIHKRKEAFLKRFKAMAEYATQHLLCRSSTLANYFTGIPGAACGICDNCLIHKNEIISAEEYSTISSRIQYLATNGDVHAKKIEGMMREPVSKYKVEKVMAFLLEEQRVQLSGEGYLVLGTG